MAKQKIDPNSPLAHVLGRNKVTDKEIELYNQFLKQQQDGWANDLNEEKIGNLRSFMANATGKDLKPSTKPIPEGSTWKEPEGWDEQPKPKELQTAEQIAENGIPDNGVTIHNPKEKGIIQKGLDGLKDLKDKAREALNPSYFRKNARETMENDINYLKDRGYVDENGKTPLGYPDNPNSMGNKAADSIEGEKELPNFNQDFDKSVNDYFSNSMSDAWKGLGEQDQKLLALDALGTTLKNAFHAKPGLYSAYGKDYEGTEAGNEKSMLHNVLKTSLEKGLERRNDRLNNHLQMALKVQNYPAEVGMELDRLEREGKLNNRLKTHLIKLIGSMDYNTLVNYSMAMNPLDPASQVLGEVLKVAKPGLVKVAEGANKLFGGE